MKLFNECKQIGIASFWVLATMVGATSCLLIPHQATMQKILWCILGLFGLIEVLRNSGVFNSGSIAFNKIPLGEKILFLFLLPYLGAALLSFAICFIRNDQLGTAVQAFTTVCFVTVDVFMSIYLVRLYGKHSIIFIAAAIIISYLFTIGYAVVKLGLDGFVNRILIDDYHFMESHDVGVAVVPPIILAFYYILFHRERTPRLIVATMIMGVILVVCGKRSAYLSLFLGSLSLICTYFIDLKLSNKAKKRSIILFGFSGVVVCLLYIMSIHFGWLDFISEGLGTLSDRYYVWKWFDETYSLDPSFIGYGFGYVHKLMSAGLAAPLVNAYEYLHNSLLQIYIEMGFLYFILWMFLLFLVIPLFALKHAGYAGASYLFTMIIAMVSMWTVDNTLTYPLYLVTFFIAVYSYFISPKNVSWEQK